ncbi:hypothetical protein FOL47_005650 [Perkinsus chesapeaki]|uniref:Uncharacterized protein n=1 Tax=Perkinsus chesapeaki TaxID=330153 RepID=A0A7J6LWG4_PERCH|nr:hypothetical protein FOL47_005650 [Perkinsus chesapeaki]
MVLLSIWLAIVAQATLTVVAQPAGRYLYRDSQRGFAVTFYIDTNMVSEFTFSAFSPGSLFIDFNYPLRQETGDRYAIDFTSEAVNKWYAAIKPYVNFNEGDLTAITFTSEDSFYVMLDGRRLDLLRRAYSPRVGTFSYSPAGFPLVRMNFTVQPEDRLTMRLSCGSRQVSSGPLNLVENDQLLKFKSYDLVPVAEVSAFRSRVSRACRLFQMQPGDLTYVVFSSWTNVFTLLGGQRFVLTKN